MIDNRFAYLYAVVAVGLTAVLRLHPAPCPLETVQTESDEIRFEDPTWGAARNVAILHNDRGDDVVATEQEGRHRMVTVVNVRVPGIYRIAVETEFEGAQNFMLEAGGGVKQPYVLLAGNPKTGVITEKKGDLLASGVEHVGNVPYRYRWWLDLKFDQIGTSSFNIGMLSWNQSQEFQGTRTCKVLFSNPSFELIKK